MRPFLKWAGGKTRAMPFIDPVLRQFLEARPHSRLVIPFAGSGGEFFWLQERSLLDERVVWLNDACRPLMHLWDALKSGCAPEVARQVDCLIEREHQIGLVENARSPTNKKGKEWLAGRKIVYAQARAEINMGESSPTRDAALFAYINRAGFNGLWRTNQSGKMNAPAGNSAMPEGYSDRLRAAGTLLSSMELLHLTNLPYAVLLQAVEAGDIIYLDPPYYGGKIFRAYVNGGKEWDYNGQRSLRSFGDACVDKGATVIISNSIDALPLWRDWDHKKFTVDRTISCKGKERNPAYEMLAWRDGWPSMTATAL